MPRLKRGMTTERLAIPAQVSAYDPIPLPYELEEGADLDDRFHESCHKRGIHLSSQTPISAVGGLETKDEKEWQRGGGRLKCRLEMRTSRT
jgi:hypothetical protein